MRERKLEQTVSLINPNLNIYSLVMAAGQASRFGGAKMLAEYQGESLVRRSLKLGLRVTGGNTVLVVGGEWRRVFEDCGSIASFIVRNEDYESGMAASIACGTRAVQPVADAVMILLADQPLITADHLLSMEQAWRASPSSIIATEFDGVVGPPVIFPAAYFSALSALSGDAGARVVIENNSEVVIRIPFADAAIDIDTPEDLQRLQV
jgi:molybdenum cofactor cytidylyltransferase